jgi:NADH dehydrogenase
MRVLVLGGAGFLGRHVAAALCGRGHEVILGSRKTAPRAFEVRHARFEALTCPDAWAPLIDGIDAVVNCVGILREWRAATYDAVHHRALAALAAACAAKHARLVHVSALGLDAGARSGFIRSKCLGEAALWVSSADFTIVRPSLLDGDGGFGARWLRFVARWPVHFVPADAAGRIAVLDVKDAAAAIARLAEMPGAAHREAELGGVEWRTMAQHLAALRGSSVPVVRVPAFIARMVSHVCDALHFSPFSFGHLELLRRDNVPRPNALPALLGAAARRIGATNDRAAASARDRASPRPSAIRGDGSTPSARAP